MVGMNKNDAQNKDLDICPRGWSLCRRRLVCTRTWMGSQGHREGLKEQVVEGNLPAKVQVLLVPVGEVYLAPCWNEVGICPGEGTSYKTSESPLVSGAADGLAPSSRTGVAAVYRYCLRPTGSWEWPFLPGEESSDFRS